MELNYLIKELKTNGYKITQQRKAILQVLISNINNLLSAEQLLSGSKEIFKKTNMSTVYRNLEILEELDLIYKITVENGISLYKLPCSLKHHHHIICKECGKTEVIDFCPISIFQQIAKDKNYQLTDHKLELYGYCTTCQSLNKTHDKQ